MDQFTSLSNFKADEEVQNQVSITIPNCIKELPKEHNDREALTNEETKEAMNELLNKEFIKLKYHKDVKHRVDPVLPGQVLGLISFIPSKNASPDSQGCFGVLKLRGTFASINEADRWAENILRNYDSYSDIDYAFVGRDFPIMVDNTSYCSTTREIDIRKKIDDTVKENIRKKKEEERREIEEIQERQQKLLNTNSKEEKEEEEKY